MISTRTDDASGYQQHGNANDQDDDIIGEEVRPLPIDSSMDSRMRALHALLQDHTYVQWPKKAAMTATVSVTNVSSVAVNNVPLSIPSNIMPPTAGKTTFATAQSVQGKTSNTGATHPKQQLQHQQHHQSTTSQIIDSVVAGAGGPIQLPPTNTIKYNHQPKQAPASIMASSILATQFIPGFPFTYNAMNKGIKKHNAHLMTNNI